MSAKWLAVLVMVAAACGSQGDLQAGIAEPTSGAATTDVPPSTEVLQVTDSTAPGTIYKQVQMEATLPPLDGRATL